MIVGTYEKVVTITDSDTSGATSIVTSGSPNQLSSSSDTVKLNYTGLSIAPATIGAHATGATAAIATFTPVLAPIVFGSSDTMNPSFLGIDLYATSGTGSSAGFTASEVGWTNAPYNKGIGATGDTNCASFASVVPSTGTSFTATVARNAERREFLRADAERRRTKLASCAVLFKVHLHGSRANASTSPPTLRK